MSSDGVSPAGRGGGGLPESGDGEEALTQLTSIWDCGKLNKVTIDGKDGKSVPAWTCMWCPLKANGQAEDPFRHMNATKALAHVLKKPGCGIRACKGRIPPNFQARYEELCMMQENRKEQRDSGLQTLREDIEQSQVLMLPLFLINTPLFTALTFILLCFYFHCTGDYIEQLSR